MDPTVKPVGSRNVRTPRSPSKSTKPREAWRVALLGEERVLRIYTFRDDLIARIDVEQPTHVD